MLTIRVGTILPISLRHLPASSVPLREKMGRTLSAIDARATQQQRRKLTQRLSEQLALPSSRCRLAGFHRTYRIALFAE